MRLHYKNFNTPKEAEDYAEYNLLDSEWNGVFQTKNDKFKIKLRE